MAEADAADFPVLPTDRLYLRAVTPGDAAAFRALLSIPEVTRHSNWPDAPTEEQGIAFVQRMSEQFGRGNGCAWIVEDRWSGDFMGAVRINYVNRDWRCGGVGYELHPRFWARGIMTEALRAVVACAHTTFGLNHIEAWTLPGNGASDRVLEKTGFRHEGTLRRKAWFKGAYHDLRLFGRVAGDPVC